MKVSGVLRTAQFDCRKGLGTCGALLVPPIHCKVHWKVGRWLGSYRLILELPLIGFGKKKFIRELSISSVMWLLEVLCGLY